MIKVDFSGIEKRALANYHSAAHSPCATIMRRTFRGGTVWRIDYYDVSPTSDVVFVDSFERDTKRAVKRVMREMTGYRGRVLKITR